MTLTQALVDEHRLILKALDVLDAAASRLEAGESVPEDWWPTLVAWLRDFADARHHAKEENVLFPAMVRCGAPERGGPIDVMLEEHVMGRELVATMAAGGPGDRASTARRYARLLRDHIDKENAILFPFAEAIVDPATEEKIRRDFAAADLAQAPTSQPEAAEATLDRLSLEVTDLTC